MPIMVYISEQCTQDAEKYHAKESIQTLKEKIEQEQALWCLEPFRHPFWVKKRLGDKRNRLICRIESHEIQGIHYDILIFLTILLRSDKHYQTFYQHPIEEGNRYYQSYIEKNLIQYELEQQQQQKTVENKPYLPEHEKDFLFSSRYQIIQATMENIIYSSMIYESWSWVEYASHSLEKHELLQIFNQLQMDIEQNDGRFVLYENDDYYFVLYNFKAYSINYLNIEAKHDEAKLSERNISYQQILKENLTSEQFINHIERVSRRAYIQEICLDFEYWWMIQENLSSNLVLSPEEAAILQSIQANEHPFPLFINGRAGSGKSTMLQMLFTEYLLFSHQQNHQRDLYPIYFSCNQPLVKKAIETIEYLLKNQVVQGRHSLSLPQVEQHCHEFRKYLHHLLNKQDKAKFSFNRYIGYAAFRQLWTKKFGFQKEADKKYPASLSWHIIRSFIKGLRSDSLLEPEDYLELESAQQHISIECFELIYERVWLHWYKPLCEQENYWDDQDLARFILEQDLLKQHYPAIFCDESQDFTRIEFQIILRLNTFSRYHIPPQYIQSIPLVFAGDQFQTLNPTGFRWEAIKAQVVEQFIFSLDPARTVTLSAINYQELSYNFRCSHHIAKFSNTVHGWRAKLLDLPYLKPQRSWHIQDASQDVVFIDVEDDVKINRIKQQYDLTIVLPCLDGEEIEYIKKDSYLSKLIQIDENNGSTSIPVYSVIRSKGLEFNRVIVYGFAQDFELSNAQYKKDQQQISIEYYLNRLYVAVTRARKQLWVLEQKKHYNTFWQNFIEPAEPPFELKQLDSKDNLWRSHLGTLRLAKDDDLAANFNQEVDMRKNAEYTMQQGLVENDVFLLRQAAGLFDKLAEITQRDTCLAQAYYLEAKFSQAAALFMSIQSYQRAFDSYWRANDWQQSYQLVVQDQVLQQRKEYDILALICHQTAKDHDIIAVYQNILQYTDLDDELYYQKAWQHSLASSFKQLLAQQEQHDWKNMFPVLKELEQHHYFNAAFDVFVKKEQRNILAESAYLADIFEQACYYWEKSRDDLLLKPLSPQYEQSIIEVRPFPSNLHALVTLDQTDKLLQSLYNYQEPDYFNSQQWGDLLDFLNQYSMKEHFKPIIEQYLPFITKIDFLDKLIKILEINKANKTWLSQVKALRLFRACISGDWKIVIDKLKEYTKIDANLMSGRDGESKIERYIQEKNNLNKIGNKPLKISTELEIILHGLLYSNQYDEINKKAWDNVYNQQIMTLLQGIFKVSFNQKNGSRIVWRTDFEQVILLGGVLEKSQFFSEASRFYSRLERRTSFNKIAEQRSFKSLLRFAEFLHLERSDIVKIEEVKAEILEREAKLDINVNDLPEYPVVSDIDTIVKRILNIQKPLTKPENKPKENIQQSVQVEAENIQQSVQIEEASHIIPQQIDELKQHVILMSEHVKDEISQNTEKQIETLKDVFEQHITQHINQTQEEINKNISSQFDVLDHKIIVNQEKQFAQIEILQQQLEHFHTNTQQQFVAQQQDLNGLTSQSEKYIDWIEDLKSAYIVQSNLMVTLSAQNDEMRLKYQEFQSILTQQHAQQQQILDDTTEKYLKQINELKDFIQNQEQYIQQILQQQSQQHQQIEQLNAMIEHQQQNIQQLLIVSSKPQVFKIRHGKDLLEFIFSEPVAKKYVIIAIVIVLLLLVIF